MKIRKTVSLDKKDLEVLKPFLDIYNNNLSLALRQLIEQYRQRNSLEKGNAELIPVSLVKWLLKTNQIVPPLGTYMNVMEMFTKQRSKDGLAFIDYFNEIISQSYIFGYQVRQNLEVGTDSKNIRITYEAEDPDYLKCSVINYSCLLAHHPLKLKINKVAESPFLFIVHYARCDDEEEAYQSVVDHFGYNQFIFDEIQKNIPFWRMVINILRTINYETLIISRSIFLNLLNSCEFSHQLVNLIFIIYGVSVEDTDYHDIIRFIDEILKTKGLIYRIKNNNNEIRIYHTFEDKNIIRLVNETFIKILEISGQSFNPEKEERLTVLKRRT